VEHPIARAPPLCVFKVGTHRCLKFLLNTENENKSEWTLQYNKRYFTLVLKTPDKFPRPCRVPTFHTV
jgi:hypothetical protein